MITVIAHLAVRVGPLLSSARMILTGVERVFLSNRKLHLKGGSDNYVSTAMGGAFSATVTQSRTAVAFNGAGFAVSSALHFSDLRLAEILDCYDQVVSDGRLALIVPIAGDAAAVRRLVAEEDRMRIEEQKTQEYHVKRLHQGASASLATASIHQETLRLLKQIRAALSRFTYPISEETGDLLESRPTRPVLAVTSI